MLFSLFPPFIHLFPHQPFLPLYFHWVSRQHFTCQHHYHPISSPQQETVNPALILDRQLTLSPILSPHFPSLFLFIRSLSLCSSFLHCSIIHFHNLHIFATSPVLFSLSVHNFTRALILYFGLLFSSLACFRSGSLQMSAVMGGKRRGRKQERRKGRKRV